MRGLFGDNIRDTIKLLRGDKPMEKTKYQVEFPMCGHPELLPTRWNQPRPEPARTIGSCPVHNHTCPICGFGRGQYPS